MEPCSLEFLFQFKRTWKLNFVNVPSFMGTRMIVMVLEGVQGVENEVHMVARVILALV